MSTSHYHFFFHLVYPLNAGFRKTLVKIGLLKNYQIPFWGAVLWVGPNATLQVIPEKI